MSTPTAIVQRTLDLAEQIQQIPAPTFNEGQRAQLISNLFHQEGLAEIGCDAAGNCFGRLPGESPSTGPMLVVSAHLDTVFPASTDLHLQKSPEHLAGPGIGDNSLGVAGLFGLLWLLRQRQDRLPGDLWLVANTGEEGLGNLVGMKAVVDRFGSRPLAYIVLEGMGLGKIFHRGLGVQRYRCQVHTAGGHSWIDYGQPSAIHEISRLVNRLTAVPLPAEPRTTLNIGVIGGGTSVNTIASQAFFDLDLRSERPDTLKQIAAQVEAVAAQSQRTGISITTEIIGNRPPGEIAADHWLVRLAQSSLQDIKITPSLGIGSTDANVPLSRGLPAVCIGLTRGKGAHTLEEMIETAPLALGLEQLDRLVNQAWQQT